MKTLNNQTQTKKSVFDWNFRLGWHHWNSCLLEQVDGPYTAKLVTDVDWQSMFWELPKVDFIGISALHPGANALLLA